jgi:putative ABC transport system substrate-binding protein
MDRRRFVGTFAGGLVMARSVAEAQPAAKVYRVGFLLGATAESVASLFNALEEGLRDLGYIEGRNLVFERRYADGKIERLPELAAELVQLRGDHGYEHTRRSRPGRDVDNTDCHGLRG